MAPAILNTQFDRFFHLLRWARRKDDIQLLWTTRTGVTGLIALVATPFIVLPMSLPILKRKLTFELRKSESNMVHETIAFL